MPTPKPFGAEPGRSTLSLIVTTAGAPVPLLILNEDSIVQ